MGNRPVARTTVATIGEHNGFPVRELLDEWIVYGGYQAVTRCFKIDIETLHLMNLLQVI